LESGQDIFGEPGQLSPSGNCGVDGIAFDQQGRPGTVLVLPGDPVVEPAGIPGQFIDRSLDGKQVVIEGRCLVAGMGFSDRQDQSQRFYLFIGTDMGPHQFGSALFEIAQKIGVVDDSTSICVAIEDPDLDAINEGSRISHSELLFQAGIRSRYSRQSV